MPTPAAPSGPPWSPMRVLLVADHPIVVAGVRLLLDTAPGITVVGTAPTVAEALALAAHTQPDILLLDLDLGGEQGAACIPALLEAAPAARLVVLTGVRDPEAHRQAVRHGALGLVVKAQAPAMLRQALVQVHTGGVWLEPPLVAWALRALPPPARPPASEAAAITRLTAREREVIPNAVDLRHSFMGAYSIEAFLY